MQNLRRRYPYKGNFFCFGMPIKWGLQGLHGNTLTRKTRNPASARDLRFSPCNPPRDNCVAQTSARVTGGGKACKLTDNFWYSVGHCPVTPRAGRDQLIAGRLDTRQDGIDHKNRDFVPHEAKAPILDRCVRRPRRAEKIAPIGETP